jgi:pimeloyl-[acyl-carrier protein] synthase
VAALVLAHMLGVARDDIPRFVAWTEEICKTLEALTEPERDRAATLEQVGRAATVAACAYAGQQLEQRRIRGESDDLIGMLAFSPVAATMSDLEQRAAVAQFIVAGHDNTAHLLSEMLVALAQHPDQRSAIARDRSLIPQSIEEVLRWRGPTRAGLRITREDVVFDGVTVPQGTQLLLLIAAANRDPERWHDPDLFDIFRPARRHLALALGTYVCLGVNLVRIEAEVFLTKVLDVIPTYVLVDDSIEYTPPFFMSGPRAVRIAAR